jgi:phage shock protein PspC (stress-responsive transcriptional regulator)
MFTYSNLSMFPCSHFLIFSCSHVPIDSGVDKMSSMSRTLRRSVYDARLAGVCGGIAEHYGWDPTMVRVAYAVLSIVPGLIGLGVFLYIVLWAVIPQREYP